jgi:Flp pilus assembly protein TadB
MNAISSQQNQDSLLTLLAAQRLLYSQEKMRLASWVIIVLIVTMAGTGAIRGLEEYVPFFTFSALLLAAGEYLYLKTLSKKREQAARIQEMFDCKLFQLEWNKFLAGKPPSVAIIATAADQLRRKKGEWEKLRDWYGSAKPGLPLAHARLLCQRENLSWDSGLRRTYAVCVLSLVSAIAILLFLAALKLNLGMANFFGIPMIIFFPLFTLGLSHAWTQWRVAQRSTELHEALEEVLESFAQGKTEDALLTQAARNLQNEIFHQRADNLPVWNWFYNILKKSFHAKQQLTNQVALPQ